MMLRENYSYAVCVRQLYIKTQNSGHFEMPGDHDSIKKPFHSKHYSINRKHIFLDAKFEVGLLTQFMRKFMSKKKYHQLSWGMVRPFPKIGV
jgi:hypothetical protein